MKRRPDRSSRIKTSLLKSFQPQIQEKIETFTAPENWKNRRSAVGLEPVTFRGISQLLAENRHFRVKFHRAGIFKISPGTRCRHHREARGEFVGGWWSRAREGFAN